MTCHIFITAVQINKYENPQRVSGSGIHDAGAKDLVRRAAAPTRRICDAGAKELRHDAKNLVRRAATRRKGAATQLSQIRRSSSNCR